MISDSTPIQLPFAGAQPRSAGARRPLRLAPLRAPLASKLVGANLLVVAVLFGAWLVAGNPVTRWAIVIFVFVVLLHRALVAVALRPIRDLEEVASRVWRGDIGARVVQSSVADTGVLRIGSMFNILLDGLSSDRARMRTLASEVIAAGDRERATLARELHDSTAQQLTALVLQLSAAARDCADSALAARLGSALDSAKEIAEEVRLLSNTVHSRVLDDLGLVPALRKLLRDATAGTGIDVDLVVTDDDEQLPLLAHGVASVLYRVAQEAVRNAVRHACPRRVQISLTFDRPLVRLVIGDDGIGFDPPSVERRRPGVGLLSMRDRLTLLDGSFDIHTAPGNGTTVVATVDFAAPRDGN